MPTPADELVLDRPHAVHIVGIGGTGMSAIARLLVDLGHRVSGTDRAEGPALERLRALGIEARAGHGPLPDGVEVVARSSAVGDDNPDVVSARAAGVPVVSRAAVLAAIAANGRPWAVAGAHGKTTTTAMLAVALDRLGRDPAFLVGAEVADLGTNARWPAGSDRPVFAVEADESDGTFLRLAPTAAIVTNVEPDHLAYWGTADALVDGYRRFVAGVDGPVAIGIDDAGAAALLPDARRPVTFGTPADADVRIESEAATLEGGVSAALVHGDERATLRLAIPGHHNVLDAAGAIALLVSDGVDLAAAADALDGFRGAARRFERRGTAAGVTFVDSYDHLPTEVAAVLDATRNGPWDRVVCVFQPHRYTRTRDLGATFADAFVAADVLGICELYPAGETPIAGVRGKLVLDAVLDAHPGTDAAWLPDLDAAERWLLGRLRPGDLCLTLNAGDLTTLPDRLIARLGGGDHDG